MKRLFFYLMLSLAAICALSCKKTEKNDNALLQGTQWKYMEGTKALVDDVMYLSFDAETFTLSGILVRGMIPDKIRQGTFLYKKPKLTMDFAEGTVWQGIVSDEYIDFGSNGQFEKVIDYK